MPYPSCGLGCASETHINKYRQGEPKSLFLMVATLVPSVGTEIPLSFEDTLRRALGLLWNASAGSSPRCDAAKVAGVFVGDDQADERNRQNRGCYEFHIFPHPQPRSRCLKTITEPQFRISAPHHRPALVVTPQRLYSAIQMYFLSLT
jgi:hypothetical protein